MKKTKTAEYSGNVLVAIVQAKCLGYYYYAPKMRVVSHALTHSFLLILFVKGSECVGFLWRSRRPGLPELTMSARELIDKQKFTRKPFIGRFKVRYLLQVRFKLSNFVYYRRMT